MDRAKAKKAFHGNLTSTKSWNGGREEAERPRGAAAAAALDAIEDEEAQFTV